MALYTHLSKSLPLVYQISLCNMLNSLLSFQDLTSSLPGVNSISGNHFLCSSIRSNSSSIKVLSWNCHSSVSSLDFASNSSSHAISQRRQWHPTPVLLPGKSHRRRSLEGFSPRGRWGLDTTEQLHIHFSLSCVGEGNGNPLQCSCLENPRDRGAWWTAIYGVTQSRTRLKWLSSSSSSSKVFITWE